MVLRPGLALSMCATFGFAAVGCSGSIDPNRDLSGRVDTQAYALDNASVIAHTADGRQFLAAIQRDGSFTLRLPVGLRYSLAIANRTRAGGLREISLLTWHGSTGRTHAVAVAAGSAIDLGFIHPVGTVVRKASSPTPVGSDADGGVGEHDSGSKGDHDCEDHDHTQVCMDEQHDESECEHDDHDGLDCDDDKSSGGSTKDGGSLSATSEGSHGGGDDHGEDHDHGDDDATTCSTPATPTTPSTTPTPGSSGGGAGTACLVSADCAAPLSCIASQCAPIVL